MGWASKRNGELLGLAAARFDIFVTVDRNPTKQHDIAQCNPAVVVLVAPSNRLADLKPLVPRLAAVLVSVRPGQAVEVV